MMCNPKKVGLGCAEKALDKIRHSFMIKALNKLGTEENFLNLTRDIREKSTNIRLGGAR